MLIGISTGMNLCSNLVFMKQRASSKKVCDVGLFIQQMAFASGSAWVNIIAFFLLEKITWRMFLLVLSLPVFIPPIVILQCFMEEVNNNISKEEEISINNEDTPIEEGSNENPEIGEKERPARILRKELCNLGLLCSVSFITLFQGLGSIILAPSVIRRFNSEANASNDDPCDNIVKGFDFLILAAINGGANILGRIIGFSTHDKFSFRIIQSILSLGQVICYGCLLIPHENLAMASSLMGTIKLIYAIQVCEIYYGSVNPVFYRKIPLSIGCALVWGFGSLGSTTGIAFAAFLDSWTATLIALALSSFKVVCTTLINV